MKNKLFRLMTLLALSLTLSLGTTTEVTAQCPMCRMSAETNLKNGGTAGRGLNNGILYMLATPYLIIGGLAFVWWRNRRKEEDDQELVETL